MNNYFSNLLPVKHVRQFIVLFYIVGIIGFVLPYSRSLFISITPLALVLSASLLALFHDHYNVKNVVVFLAIFILGFAVEAIGVNTGAIFGSYSYGDALGVKVFNTPLLIGLNWLLLTYLAISVSEYLFRSVVIQIVAAPTLMVIYDLVLEQLAPKIDFWSWSGHVIPIQNYMAWWIIAALFVIMIKRFKVDTKNPLALILFICQFLFFLIMHVVFNVIQ